MVIIREQKRKIAGFILSNFSNAKFRYAVSGYNPKKGDMIFCPQIGADCFRRFSLIFSAGICGVFYLRRSAENTHINLSLIALETASVAEFTCNFS
jgi:hypothetical protein